jgi:hypothetical protein
MADVFCPACGKANPSELEKCQFCGSRLKPFASSYLDAVPIKPGENPVIKSTSEFEKVKLATSDLVRPGEEPTVKSTSALESTLPSWLRSLRKAEEAAEGKTEAGAAPDQRLPLSPPPAASPDLKDDQPDWLPGLGKEESEDEKDVPDWLASLREEKPDSSTLGSSSLQDRALNTTGSLSAGVADADWMARLGGEPNLETSETKPQGETLGEGESLDWLDSVEKESSDTATGETPVADQDEALHEWLSALPAGESTNPEEISPVPGGVATPSADQDETLQGWLSTLPAEEVAIQGETPPAPVTDENLVENQVQPLEKIIEPEPPLIAPDKPVGEADTPDWLTNLGSIPSKVEEPPEEILPEWLAGVETKPESEPATPAPTSGTDLPATPISTEEIPNWLSEYQAESAAAEQQEIKNKQAEGTGPLPEWLVGIEKTPTSPEATPALVGNEESPVPSKKVDQEFSLEMPDWISKLNPEQAFGKASGGSGGPSTPENLELSELPSWVQAMRPVESVVAATRETPQEEAQAPEQSGPLAGLQGVLPVSPGLGTLRKPPAYTAILQVTDGQQRYAAALERMISGGTKPLVAGRTRLTSNRVWRWLITLFLFAAVLIPLVTGIPATPASTLRPPETMSAFTLVGNLPSNAPVLVVFDYEPALSGELEAAAAPFMDHLLLQGPRLSLISTNPTGPALAERFMQDANASPLIAGHNYQPGLQYVDLGYLAGGSSGVQYFASAPADAAPFTLDGQQAWTLPPLLGVRALRDFAAIIILTDSADSGRVWIEQTGTSIGETPMLMVISAQVEPMILPYYGSGQIKGLVTGLAGGESYGQMFTRPESTPGFAEKYWNSFGVGTLVSEILIVIGAIWSAVAGWRSRRDKSGEKV